MAERDRSHVIAVLQSLNGSWKLIEGTRKRGKLLKGIFPYPKPSPCLENTLSSFLPDRERSSNGREAAVRTAAGRSQANLLIEKSVNLSTEFTLICTHYVSKFFLSKMAATTPTAWGVLGNFERVSKKIIFLP